MNKKLRVGIVMGGKSAEHEVSLQSAKSVLQAMDRSKYEPVLFGVTRDGRWHGLDPDNYLLNPNDPKRIALNIPAADAGDMANSGLAFPKELTTVDVVFPVLHGPFGEDGTIQGLLKLAGVPFVGAGVLGSAIGMDKDVMKRLLRDAGLPIAKFLVYRQVQKAGIDLRKIEQGLGMPMFVKPANMGSSVGIRKAHDAGELASAIDEAFRYDSKVIIEEFIDGREIECSVLGNDAPIASLPGEIIPQHEFYSYEAKYLDEHGAAMGIPAKLSPALVEKAQELAVKTFQVLCCEGMARVDLFLRGKEEFIINEINTIPGFTRISMYPKLWQASGIPYSELIDRLIQLAIERFERESELEMTTQQ